MVLTSTVMDRSNLTRNVFSLEFPVRLLLSSTVVVRGEVI